MKLSQIVDNVEALKSIGNNKLPAKTSFTLGKFLEVVDKEVKGFDKVRNEKVREYGEPVLNEDGTANVDQFRVLPENLEKFKAELLELLEAEVDITIPEISVSELGDIAIEPSVLVKLDWLIKA